MLCKIRKAEIMVQDRNDVLNAWRSFDNNAWHSSELNHELHSQLQHKKLRQWKEGLSLLAPETLRYTVPEMMMWDDLTRRPEFRASISARKIFC